MTTDTAIPHPDIACWLGERTWTAAGEAPSEFAVWATDDNDLPARITHGRDMMMDGDAVTQDYNFIDYRFGASDAAVMARHYLGDREVSIRLPTDPSRPPTIAAAERAIPREVLQYLQKRFDAIRVLVDTGYATLWSLAGPEDQA